MNSPAASSTITCCQVCNSKNLDSVLFLGFLPPVNTMPPIGGATEESPFFPAELLQCQDCHLVQLSCVVDAEVLFPSHYPYTSSTTKILRENFAELYQESSQLLSLEKKDLVVDIGSNDGNLLSNFTSHRVLGITPEEIGKIAIERGIPTLIDYFSETLAERVVLEHGKAKIVTATNVFAHIDNVNGIVKGILNLLDDKGAFISESHYLLPLLETLQYDTIYHEHLRYYSLTSINNLLERHGLQVFHAKEIPTHGGSVRVYAGRKNVFPVQPSVQEILAKEADAGITGERFPAFRDAVAKSKRDLIAMMKRIKDDNGKVFGISAPSRASTLINYTGLDDSMLECVAEIKGSHKIGKYIPGTKIPVVDEKQLYDEQPEYALMLSWHIADELIPKLKSRGFKGKFIVPLPEPRIVD